MSDIVTRLRAGNQVLLPIQGEAADEIERLRRDMAGSFTHDQYHAGCNAIRNEAYNEIKRLQDALDTCRELRLLDKAAEVKRLRKANAR